VGRNSSILDNSQVTATKKDAVIGDDVIISAGAYVDSAEIGDGVMIAMGAHIHPDVKIGNDSYIDARAVVVPGTVVPPGTLWTGSPARQLRTLGREEMAFIRSTAVDTANLSQQHFEQQEKSVAEVEKQLDELLWKREHSMKDTDVIPQVAPDVKRYYELTQIGDNQGLLRSHEYNVEAEGALREAEEVAADQAENAMYDELARLRKVGSALKQLSEAKPAGRDGVVAALAATDPQGAAILNDVIDRIGKAADANDASSKSQLVAAIQRFDPSIHHADDKEAAEYANKIFTKVAQLAKVQQSAQ
jgi:hypothetical protein